MRTPGPDHNTNNARIRQSTKNKTNAQSPSRRVPSLAFASSSSRARDATRTHPSLTFALSPPNRRSPLVRRRDHDRRDCARVATLPAGISCATAGATRSRPRRQTLGFDAARSRASHSFSPNRRESIARTSTRATNANEINTSLVSIPLVRSRARVRRHHTSSTMGRITQSETLNHRSFRRHHSAHRRTRDRTRIKK